MSKRDPRIQGKRAAVAIIHHGWNSGCDCAPRSLPQTHAPRNLNCTFGQVGGGVTRILWTRSKK